MSKAQVVKGRAWEQEVARLFREAGVPVTRNGHKQRSAKGSAECPDLESVWFAIECGVGVQVSHRAKLKQAQASAKEHQFSVAVVKEDRKPPAVYMSLEDFLALVEEWNKQRSE